MKPPDRRLVPPWSLILIALVLSGCGGGGAPPVVSPSAHPTSEFPELLGLAGEVTSPLLIAGPYQVRGRLGPGGGSVNATPVPATAAAAVGALAQSLAVPGPPISTSSGLGYNLGSSSGYQLTTDPSLDTFNFHPNTPTDEVGTTPTVAQADQFAENFLLAAHVPASGGVDPLDQLSTYHGSDRTIYFQWTLEGVPVVTIRGQPEVFSVDVATDRTQTMAVVGISGAVPYGATGGPTLYPAMTSNQVVKYLNSGVIKPADYLLSPSGQPFPSSLPVPSGPTALSAESMGIVDSFGSAVPVYVFQVSGDPAVGQFVTCAVAPAGCVPLRLRLQSPSPTTSG